MTYEMKNKLKAGAISILMALLFCGGILFSGADWDFPGFPWGVLIGAFCWGALAILATACNFTEAGRISDR